MRKTAKEIKFYCCEICEARYSLRADAESCERGHKIVKEVLKPMYDKDDKKNEYPDSVLVRFTDNTEARYYRRGR